MVVLLIAILIRYPITTQLYPKLLFFSFFSWPPLPFNYASIYSMQPISNTIHVFTASHRFLSRPLSQKSLIPLIGRSLALNILNQGLVQDTTRLGTHRLSKSLVWDPLARSSWGRLLHYSVNLLERKSLGLGNQEEGVDESAGAETTPDEEDGRSEVTLGCTNHVRGDDRDDGVPEPVGGGGETNTTRSDREREDLTDHNPGSWALGGGEEEDEDGDEGNLGVDGRDVVGDRVTGSVEVGVVESDGDTNDGNEELADQHAQGTPDEERTTSKPLNGVE